MTHDDAFWELYQPGFRESALDPGSPEFYADVEAKRYALEDALEEVAAFAAWRGKDVLDAGCGIATDGLQFARAGARYTGLDRSATAIELGKELFRLEGLEATFVRGEITELPFESESFDLVFSHGVVHHVEQTQRAIDEFWRVLRPQGKCIVMVYHRNSINYWITIMGVRRTLAATLLIPGVPALAQRITGARRDVLEGHLELLRRHGPHYLLNTSLFLSNNTDGPGNPLSKVYSRRAGEAMLGRFSERRSLVRYLNLRWYPGGERLAATHLGRRLEKRWGWHLFLLGTK